MGGGGGAGGVESQHINLQLFLKFMYFSMGGEKYLTLD